MSDPLIAELIPSSTWGWNLRSLLTEKGWDTLRVETYKQANYLCEVCGGKGPKHPVECHERWVYNDQRRIQKLVGLEALCPRCHEVRHLGRAFSLGRGHLVLEQLMKVNAWTLDEATRHVEEAYKVWERRNKLVWKLDVSWLETLPHNPLK